MRPSRFDDRTSRSVPREFEEYHSPHKLELARAIRSALRELAEADPSEEVVELSEGAKKVLEAAAERHPMIRRIFYEAHLDWDSALMQLRLVFEPIHCPGSLCQTVSFIDDGSGSTSKGTVRELVESCVGVHNGKEQIGYSCTLNVEALANKKAEAPSEQKANLFLCSHAFIDDFSPNVPLNNVALRQLTGGNNLTAARKGGAEGVFKFRGQIYLQANGIWRPVERFIGSDRRRHAGLSFEVKFVDHPTTKNERKKDGDIKLRIGTCFAEFWFLARVFWLVPRPRPESDRTTPLCPNSASLIKALMEENDACCIEIDARHAKQFVAEVLCSYTLVEEKPTSSSEVDAAFVKYLMTKPEHRMGVEVADAQRALRCELFFKSGHTLNKCGKRKKTSVHVYTHHGAVQTLKSIAVAFATSGSSASGL